MAAFTASAVLAEAPFDVKQKRHQASHGVLIIACASFYQSYLRTANILVLLVLVSASL